MHGPTCIFWANLTPLSLKLDASGDEHEEAAPGGSEEDAEFILSMDFEEAAKACKDNGLPVSADLQKMRQALLVHFTWSEPELRVAAGSSVLTEREAFLSLPRPKLAKDGSARDAMARPKPPALTASVPIGAHRCPLTWVHGIDGTIECG